MYLYLQEKKADMVSRFLALNETDPKYLRDIILSFVIAGRDTTAATLSWFFYMLCKHPHIQEKVVHEVGEVTKLKNTCSIDELADSLTDEALGKMHYLHAALTETLRLYPAVPIVMNLCTICIKNQTLKRQKEKKKGYLFRNFIPLKSINTLEVKV